MVTNRRRTTDKTPGELALMWMKAHPVVAAYIGSAIHDYHDAEDLIQAVALSVTNHYADHDPEKSFNAWAMGIARNKVREYYRNRKTRQQVFSMETLDMIAREHESASTCFEPMRYALRFCLRKLEGKGRRILEMRYLQQMKPADVADQIGTTRNAVFITLHRVRAALRKCIEKRMAEEEGSS